MENRKCERTFIQKFGVAQDSVKLQVVQYALRRLDEYGLGIAVPYMRDENGTIVPIPKEKVIFEDEMQISYLQLDEPRDQGRFSGMAVGQIEGEIRVQ